MNAGAGRLFTNGHHVKGEGAKTKAVFKNLEFGFCLEIISLLHGGKLYRLRCLNQFCLKSNGCYEHSKLLYKDGPNSALQDLKAGRKVVYGRIKDTRALLVETAPTPKQIKDAVVKELAVVDKQVADGLHEGEDVSHLQVRRTELWKFLSGKTRKSKDAPAPAPAGLQQGGAQDDAPLAAPVRGYGTQPTAAVLSAPIYNARTSAKDSEPGIAYLDKKKQFMQSANNSKSRKMASRAFQLQTIEEEPPVSAVPQRKKPDVDAV